MIKIFTDNLSIFPGLNGNLLHKYAMKRCPYSMGAVCIEEP